MKPEDLPLASLSAVKAKDKQRWLNLFEEDAFIQDPVGVSPTDPTGKGLHPAAEGEGVALEPCSSVAVISSMIVERSAADGRPQLG